MGTPTNLMISKDGKQWTALVILLEPSTAALLGVPSTAAQRFTAPQALPALPRGKTVDRLSDFTRTVHCGTAWGA